MKTVFLMTHIPNPRMNKRISVAKSLGNVEVICIRRADADIWEPYHTDVRHHIIDINMSSAKDMFKRLKDSTGYQKTAMRLLLKICPDCIYAESLDSLLIASRYKRANRGVFLAFEVADLKNVHTSNSARIMKAAIEFVERMAFRAVDILIVTSMKFYEMYYNKLIGREKVLLLPNMPDLNAFTGYRKKDSGKFTVGFIGGIRYIKQMKMLVDASEACGVGVLFAGEAFSISEYEEIRRYCKSKEGVAFTGKYDYHNEIASLYGRVDCIYAVYDADNPNVCIALPNKLYESIYCELPIIVAKGTYLAEVVNKWEVGVAVSHTDGHELVEALKLIKEDDKYRAHLVDGCASQREKINARKYDELLRRCLAEEVGGKKG